MGLIWTRNPRRNTAAEQLVAPRWLYVALMLFTLAILCSPARADTFTVSTDADAGAGSLREAIEMMNAAGAGPHTIDFSLPDDSVIALTSSLPPLNNNTDVTIDGSTANNLTVDGANMGQVFFVQTGTVTISTMTIENGVAQGGAGGDGAGGGGGGLGAGGALFVNTGANVTVQSVNFSGSEARGGSGGAGNGDENTGGGGGAGITGDGGDGSAAGGGGGGGGLTDGADGSGGSGGVGGSPGGSGGNTGTNGIAGTAPLGGGGGGGAGNGNGGSGRLGGGGGGGGGGAGTGGAGGFGGGTGGDQSQGGNGGDALGGQVFVANGATITIIDSNLLSPGGVGGGAGGSGTSPENMGAAGAEAGTNMYLHTGVNATIQVNAGTTTIDNQVSGAGGITKTGAGTLVLTGDPDADFANNYTGGTIVEEGTLQAGGEGAFADNTAYTVNDGTLDLNGNALTMSELHGTGGEIDITGTTLTVNNSSADESEYAGNIVGVDGSLVKDGDGFLTLTGTNTYDGGTTVLAGVLEVTTDSLQGQVDNDAAIIFVQEDDGTFTGQIHGSGTVDITGGGAITFGDMNDYTGGTLILQGSLIAGVDGALAAGSYDLRADTTLDLGGFDLTMRDSGAFAALVGDEGGAQILTGGATLTVDTELDSVFDGDITGGGELVKAGTGTLELSGTNELDTVTVEDGVLRAESEDAFPQDIDYVVNGGTLDLNDFDLSVSSLNGAGGEVALGTATLTNTTAGSDSFDGVISGEGDFVFDGPGDFTLNGLNTYTGGTTVEQGELIQGAQDAFSQNTAYTVNGGILNLNGFDTVMSQLSGDGGEVALGAAMLTIDTTENNTYAGEISGTGGLVKQGTGTQTLTGMNTYTGDTTIEAGRLNVDGEITSDTMVEEDGTLGGSGTITGNVTNAGTVSPGASAEDIATLTVDGDYTHEDTGNLEIGLNDDGVTNPPNDRLDVTGMTVINGGKVTVAPVDDNYNVGKEYTFVITDSRVGEFDEIDVDLPGFLEATLIYTDNTVSFILLRGGETYEAIGRTPNQRSVGRYLDTLAPDAEGDLQTVFNAINMIDDPAARAAFDQLSGDIHGTMSQLAVQNTDIMLAQIAQRLRSASFAAPGVDGGMPTMASLRSKAQREDTPIVLVGSGVAGGPLFEFYQGGAGSSWTPWVQGFGMGGSNDSDGNAAGVKYDAGGLVAGLERWLDHSWLFGAYGGYVGSQIGPGEPRQTINGGQAGAYLYTDDGCHYTTLLGGFEWDGYKTNRHIEFDTIDRRALASSNGWQGFAYAERGMGFKYCYSTFQPFVGLQYIHLHRNEFTESGADSINLALRDFNTDSLRLMPGARMQWALRTRNGLRLLPELHALWVHEFLDSSTTFNARFAQSGGAFIIDGLDLGENWAMLGTNLTWELGGGWSITAAYDALVNDRQQLNIGTASLGHLW